MWSLGIAMCDGEPGSALKMFFRDIFRPASDVADQTLDFTVDCIESLKRAIICPARELVALDLIEGLFGEPSIGNGCAF